MTTALDTPHDIPDTTAGQRRWILIATSLGLLAVMVSVSGLNVAQQAMAGDLGASQGELLWIINGYTLALARRMNLAACTPQGSLASTAYCLADPGREYVVYLPSGGKVTVDLSAAKGGLAVE